MEEAKQKADFGCRVCGNREGNVRHEAREMMYGLRRPFEYVECGTCGCLQIREFPADMSPYYPGDYYSFRPYGGGRYRGLGGLLRNRFNAWRSRGPGWLAALAGRNDLSLLRPLKLRHDSRILDVGCGNGKSFLYALAACGFTQLQGCDPFLPGPIRYENGVWIHNRYLGEMEGEWDLITFHHSFEHMPDPLETLQAAHERLSPGGTCLIRIPTVSSWAWQHYGVNWAQLDAPRHFFLHSRESMRLLAEQSGFDLYRTVYDSGHFQISGSEKLKRDLPLVTPRGKGLMARLVWKRKKAVYLRMAKTLNRAGRGDQAAFFLKRS